MNCRRILDKIDELAERYLSVLEDICNIESPTDNKAGVDEVGRYFIAFAQKRGWKVEICPQTVAGDAVCITMNPKARKAPVALSGHMDTVHPLGAFGYPPVKREGDKMLGPGTLDCKGGLAASLLAMDALESAGFTERPVILLLQSDEEKGSAPSQKATVRYMCERAKGAVAFLNMEGFRPTSAVVARKGILRFKFTVLGKAAHSSICYTGANAVAEAAHKILALEQMKDSEGLTCNCGMISGGITPNTVAERCEFVADIRFADKEEMRKAYDTVKALADTTFIEGCSTLLEEISNRPPMEYVERNLLLLARMNEIFAENGLPPLEARRARGGSDAAYVTDSGIPCVDSVGAQGEGEHTAGEFVYMDSIAASAKRVAAVICGL